MTVLEQLENHALYTTVTNSHASLNIINEDEDFIASLDNYAMQTLYRLTMLLNQIQTRLDLVDPLMIRKTNLDHMHSELTQINAFTSNYKANFPNVNNLNTINTRIDNILAQLTSLYYFNDVESIGGIRDSITSFKRTVGQHRNHLTRKQNELKEKQNELVKKSQSIDPLFKRIDEKFNNLFNDFTNSYSEYEKEFNSSKEVRSEEFNEKISEFQKSFEQTVNTLKEEWAQNIEENQSKASNIIETLETQQQDHLDKTKASQNQYDRLLEEHKKSVEVLVGNISTTSISGHFKAVADTKEQNIKLWHRLTVLGFAATIGFGIYAFIFSEGTEWTSLLAKLIVTTAIGSFTAYAARQVTKNEEQEKYNRQMEVELKTLNPYIAAFEDAEQIKLKEQLFPLIFGRAETKQSIPAKDTNSSSTQLSTEDINVLANMFEVLKNITNGTNRPNQ